MRGRWNLGRLIFAAAGFAVTTGALSCTPRSFHAPSQVKEAADGRERLGTSLFWGFSDVTRREWLAQDLLSILADEMSQPVLQKKLKNVLKVCKRSGGTPWIPLRELHLERQLSGSDAYKESLNSLADFERIYSFALCSLVDPERQGDFRSSALTGVMAWVNAYQPGGNPIDERNFLPMMLAIDLLGPAFSPSDQEKLRRWLEEFDAAQVRAEASWPQPVPMGPAKILFGRRLNNWKAWHLMNRVVVNRLLGRDAVVKEVGTALDLLAARQIYDDGSTLDFLVRHGLHYHLNTIEAYLKIFLVDPLLLSEATRHRVILALDFVRPYYRGEKTNIEFANSPVPFDEARANAGEVRFVHEEWKPERASRVLRMARVVFPKLRDWTAPALAAEPSNFLDSWLAIHDARAM